VGIGCLREEGLGDTVRVSLTEEPEEEIPVARMLVDRYEKRKGHAAIPEILDNPINPFAYERRKTFQVYNFGDHEVPRVIGDLSTREEIKPSSLFGYGYNYSVPLDKWNIADQAADFIYIGDRKVNFEIPGTLGLIVDAEHWSKDLGDRRFPLISFDQFTQKGELSDALNFIDAKAEELYTPEAIKNLKEAKHSVLVLHTDNDHAVAAMRRVFIELINQECEIPVVIARNYQNETTEEVQLYASTDAGALMLDGLGDGIWLRAKNSDPQTLKRLSFGILQATRTRISKTEYISCPSCGRTLFDLQETTAKIRKRTDHLKGVKIGIMGCIVNGPGEMADADYGYVGTGPGKITLYKEKEVVRRNVPSEDAVDALIDLIREHGDWVEPAET
jgi:(E)-4-hydroxy-3-methylbut-2-enyl-diphosphate synthase